MKYLSERESKTLEYKESVPPLQTLVKTCIAFANGVGGRIVLGVRDQSLEIVGLAQDDLTHLHENFPHTLYDSSPDISYHSVAR